MRGLLAIVALFIAAACAPTPQPTLYTGPTDTFNVVAARVNANADRIPSLWAVVKYYEGNFVQDAQHTQFVNGNGLLLYRSTGEFRLDGAKPGIGTLFQIGANSDRYWLKIFADQNTMWWGQFNNLSKPGVQQLPVRPDLVREVLGLGRIGPDLASSPVPVMRFNNDSRVYMVVWSIPKDDHWIPQREIWYDMATFRPKRVLLFDANGFGRVVLKADLSDPIPVSVPDQPREQWPIIAGTYRLFFPDSGSTLLFQLDQATLSKRADPHFPPAPNDGNFKFQIDPELNKVIQLDADVHS